MAMTKTKAVGLFSSSLGISIGCIMGMVPLLFMEDDWTKEMREVFSKLDVDGNGCGHCNLAELFRVFLSLPFVVGCVIRLSVNPGSW